jgi:putative PIN family toxin of toxin-antitoxin system
MILRVVFDTMVFYQWVVLPEGRLHGTARAVLDGRVRLCLSTALVEEVKDLLARPAIRAKSNRLTPDRVQAFLDRLMHASDFIAAVPDRFTFSRHPDDDHLFNLAIEAKAQRLVTWETRILQLADATIPEAQTLCRLAPDLRIVTPKMLADELGRVQS